MSNSLRVLCAVVFVAVMAVWNWLLHRVADFGGFIALMAVVGGILWAAFKVDNRDRRREDLPEWSAYEAGQGVRAYFREPTPYILLGLLAVAELIHWAESLAK